MDLKRRVEKLETTAGEQGGEAYPAVVIFDPR